MSKNQYKKLLEDFKALLKQNNLKYTSQREIILKTLYETKCHYTPDDLYNKIKNKYPEIKVGIATVYRTINLLENAKMLTSITFGSNGKKFELNLKDHHDHMICDICGKIIEFHDDKIEQAQIAITNQHGFKLKSHIMQLHGICKTCQEKESN